MHTQSGGVSGGVTPTRPDAARDRTEPHAVVIWKQGFAASPRLIRYVLRVTAKLARQAMVLIGAALVVALVAVAALTLIVMTGHAIDLAAVVGSFIR